MTKKTATKSRPASKNARSGRPIAKPALKSKTQPLRATAKKGTWPAKLGVAEDELDRPLDPHVLHEPTADEHATCEAVQNDPHVEVSGPGACHGPGTCDGHVGAVHSLEPDRRAHDWAARRIECMNGKELRPATVDNNRV